MSSLLACALWLAIGVQMEGKQDHHLIFNFLFDDEWMPEATTIHGPTLIFCTVVILAQLTRPSQESSPFADWIESRWQVNLEVDTFINTNKVCCYHGLFARPRKSHKINLKIINIFTIWKWYNIACWDVHYKQAKMEHECRQRVSHLLMRE